MRVETASDVPGTNQQQLGGIAGAAAIQLQGRLSDIAPVSDKYMRGVRGVTHCNSARFISLMTKLIWAITEASQQVLWLLSCLQRY